MIGNRRLQAGQLGERMAEAWFLNNGWHMVRTQPPVTILHMLTPAAVGALRRFIPRLAAFGHMVIARLGRGGAADYTGYKDVGIMRNDGHGNEWKDTENTIPLYRACEVKEAAGDSMPASRLDKAQRAFLAALPAGCAHVGIFWKETGKFTMHLFIPKGAYKRPC